MADLGVILGDLAAESQTIDDVVAGLPPEGWARPTPARGWTVAHQIAHLAWTDSKALISAARPERWQAEVEHLLSVGENYVDLAAEEGAAQPAEQLLAEWRAGRQALVEALANVPDGQKLPWYGPPMSVASMATARLMETWAHGQDVFDALGLTREPTGRLWHIARFGTRTRDFAYKLNSLAPPTEEFRVELASPDATTWAFGPEDAEQRLTGSAVDFCLVITQRRHPADTDLVATGADVEEWLTIAQAFAGPPGEGREPGQFA
ncbi:TIGR03084 family metal-binding protein [Amycolatopsis rhabdoformis]|uniref:TIGR03084 family metal-binding protein n=1 Tax=Amycolatopsis rhabdoformis TaxID=1448059 RepID=A0ABZ1I9X8_9PSEU|nr:TIGR03084 family metal-binding protein [Amycolatopsis rhabdoformis]WSE31220.1 TIGR03084 family metal-binding protein [Amycolatopsis rhabdoformis]